MGEKLKNEVVLPRNEMGGERTKYRYYQTLSIHKCPQDVFSPVPLCREHRLPSMELSLQNNHSIPT